MTTQRDLLKLQPFDTFANFALSATVHPHVTTRQSPFMSDLEEEMTPNLYQSMIKQMLTIEEYTEAEIALGSGIPLKTVVDILHNIEKNPDNLTLGKLLRFYSRVMRNNIDHQ